MFDSLLLNLLIALCEAFNPSDSVVDKIIYQILISDLLFVHHLTCESHDHLTVINEASLHDLRQLRNQGLLFEQKVVRTFFRIDQNASHGLEKVVEYFFEIWCGF
jgi:hypothetical protein